MEQRLQEEIYWKQRWQENQTFWHLSAPNSALVEHIDLLAPRPMPAITGQSTAPPVVFVPLCGKSLDLHWLRDQGYRVLGCEISEEALQQLFEEFGEKPRIYQENTSLGTTVEVWEIKNVKVYRCNFFDLGSLHVDAIFDRAALVALPSNTREAYAKHMMDITSKAPQILVAFEHERGKAPPYSVPLELVKNYYGQDYEVEGLSRKLKGDLIEAVYLLSTK